MSNLTSIKIPFHKSKLLAIIENGEILVPIRPICEDIGLDTDAQRKLINNDEVLSSTTVVTTVEGKNGKKRKMFCLPLNFLNGWLFKISTKRYKGITKEKIIKYQFECYQVLHDYFNNGGAINPKATNQQLQIMKSKIEYLEQYMSETPKGTISKVNGRTRDNMVKCYPRSNPRKAHEMQDNQPDFFKKAEETKGA